MEDIPVGDEGICGVEQTKEADVVDDFISNEQVQVVGIGGDVGEQCTEDKRSHTHWDKSASDREGTVGTDLHRRT